MWNTIWALIGIWWVKYVKSKIGVFRGYRALKNVSWFKKLENHFYKHWSEFWVNTKEEYYELAKNFAMDNKSKYLLKINKYWDSILKYDKERNILLSVDIYTNNIRTFFKPDPVVHGYKTNLDYFKSL